jgi:hypothetical protein
MNITTFRHANNNCGKQIFGRKLLSGAAVSFAIFLILGIGRSADAQTHGDVLPTETGTVRVDAMAGHAINSFDPDRALGSSIDVLSRTDIDQVYSPHIIQESLSAGWGPITYRNNTELRMAAWHWTENGTWSDAAHKSGYFTGSTELKEPIRYILSLCVTAPRFCDQRRSASARA